MTWFKHKKFNAGNWLLPNKRSWDRNYWVFWRRKRPSLVWPWCQRLLIVLAVVIVALILLTANDWRVALQKSRTGWSQLASAAGASGSSVSTLKTASQDLISATVSWRHLNFWWGWLPVVNQVPVTGQKITESGIQLARVGLTANQFDWSQLQATSFAGLTPAARQKFLDQLAVATQQTASAVQTLTDLQKQYQRELKFFLPPDKLARVDSQLKNLQTKVASGQILLSLAGYNHETNHLLIFQNSSELRPSGGFIGTYGLVKIKNGNIESLTTDDSYHLDMPASQTMKITPPLPLAKYLKVDGWFMRDANWSPDWPTAARQTLWFYQTESRLAQVAQPDKIDWVIGWTPQVFADLLNLVGGVTVKGQTYQFANFLELLQFQVSVNFRNVGIAQWDRKQIVGQVAAALQTKLLALPISRWPEIAAILQKNIMAKNIMLYAPDDPVAQNWASTLAADGALRPVVGDYLLLVDCNMAAWKTDAAIKRQMSYQISRTGNHWLAKLTINYAHLGKLDWRTTSYRDYLRVFVPAGSQLLSSSGLTDQATVQELGRQSFGGFFALAPGALQTVELDYQLPDNIGVDKTYHLTLDNQPGNNVAGFRFDFLAPNKLKSYSPTGLTTVLSGDNQVGWQQTLTANQDYSVSWQ